MGTADVTVDRPGARVPPGAARLESLANWQRYRPSLCRGCWAACCRLPVEATAEDLVRLGLLAPDEASSSLKKAARRLQSSGIVQQYRAATGLFTLSQTAAGDCVFLGPDRRCSVYERRPGVCRLFPTEVGPRRAHCPALHPSPREERR